MVDGKVEFCASGDLLDVEVPTPIPCPRVSSSFSEGGNSDHSEHRFDGE